MILYFSATGNTKRMAEALAERLQDELLDLLPRIKNGDCSEIRSEQPFVICSPVYVSELPAFVADYLKKASFRGSREVYGVFTNGGYSGIAGGQLKRIVRRKKLQFKGYAEFKLVSNHITNKSHRDLSDEEIRERFRAALLRADDAARVIRSGDCFRNRRIFLLEYLVTLPLAPVFFRLNQGTKGFRAGDRCISCGKCERLCPMNMIELRDGKPVWNADHCAHCMSCIQNCPPEAIEFKTVTEGRRRYRAANVGMNA